MAYTTPRTWVAGEVLTAAQMNTDVRDNVSFLANPPACRAYNSGTISVPSNTPTLVTFDSERYDTDSMHSTVTNTSRVTLNKAGLYLLTFTGEFAAGTDYRGLYAFFRANGTGSLGRSPFQANSPSGDTVSPGVAVSTVWKFSAADYVEVVVYQLNSAAAARNLVNGATSSPEFTATWLGLG